MKVAIYCASKPRNQRTASIFAKGVMAHGYDAIIRSLDRTIKGNAGIYSAGDEDIAVIIEAKDPYAFAFFREAKIPFMYVGHAYNQDGNWRRVVVGAVQPTHYVGRLGMPVERFERLGWQVDPWRIRKDYWESDDELCGHIVIAAEDAEAHRWQGLPPVEPHTRELVRNLSQYTKRPIVFRKKPNSIIRSSIPGTIEEPEGVPLRKSLTNAHALVTVSSSACLTALLMGIPSIILGDGVTRNLSSTTLNYIEFPYLAHMDQRMSLLSDLAYCQWSLAEISDGKAWDVLSFIARRLNDDTPGNSR